MTNLGGASYNGVIFKVNTDGTGYTILHSFGDGSVDNDGLSPYGGLITSASGSSLYGMTYYGGAAGYGTVFKVNTNGTGYTILHSFGDGSVKNDGSFPAGSLILSGSTLCGVTTSGGSEGYGTAFKMNTDGTGETILHSFGDGTVANDGLAPIGTPILSSSVLYGMTCAGGANDGGTIFSLPLSSPQTYSISGTVTAGGAPLGGVTMSLSGTASTTTTTASDGTYSFPGLSKGSYTVTPSMAGWSFSPQNAKVTVTNTNVTGQKFTAVPLYSISGKVTLQAGGGPLSGVTITLSGAAKGSATTGSDGSYSFANHAKGAYTVTPSMTGYTFTPSNISITLNKNMTGQNFTAVAPSITVTSPKGGETWSVGEKHNITWSYGGAAGSNVKIELVKGSTTAATIASSTSIGKGGTGSYTWTVPTSLVIGSDYKVRVTSTTNGSVTAMSQGTFTIKGGISITVTSPGGGETWAAGSTHNITWTYTGSPGSTVNIKLLNQGAVVSSIKTAASIGKGGSGSYAWTIPKLSSGSSYQVQVTSTANGFCTSISNDFTITSATTSAGPDQER
jgi:inhibitor of cysteine peptidase